MLMSLQILLTEVERLIDRDRAEIDRDGDQLKYEVHVVKADGSSEKLKINGSDGKVASAK